MTATHESLQRRWNLRCIEPIYFTRLTNSYLKKSPHTLSKYGKGQGGLLASGGPGFSSQSPLSTLRFPYSFFQANAELFQPRPLRFKGPYILYPHHPSNLRISQEQRTSAPPERSISRSLSMHDLVVLIEDLTITIIGFGPKTPKKKF